MILSLICAGVLQSMTASDFFPTTPGIVRVYKDSRTDTLLTNTVRTALDAGGAQIIPITEDFGGATSITTYYKVEGSQVVIYAFDVNHPLPSPMPIFRIGDGKIAWDFQGKTATGTSGEALRLHGQTEPGGQRTVLGKKVDVILSKVAWVQGVGLAEVAYDEKAVYARGLGLVERTTIQYLGKKKIQNTYKLISFEPGK